jgi:DNA-binding MarR family transcriptional regulator
MIARPKLSSFSGVGEAGLVKAERSTEDRRVVPIEITEKGRKLFETADSAYNDIAKHIMRSIARDDMKGLEKLLKTMKSNMEK